MRRIVWPTVFVRLAPVQWFAFVLLTALLTAPAAPGCGREQKAQGAGVARPEAIAETMQRSERGLSSAALVQTRDHQTSRKNDNMSGVETTPVSQELLDPALGDDLDWAPFDGSEQAILGDLSILTDGVPVHVSPVSDKSAGPSAESSEIE